MQEAGSSGSGMRILLIRPSALGDVLRTVPMLVSLRQAFPGAAIDWLVHESFVDAVRHHPALTDVVPFQRRKLSRWLTSPTAALALLRYLRMLRSRRYDLVVDVQGLFRSGLFALATGARERVGFADAREVAWLAYTRRCSVSHRLHAVDAMLALLPAIEVKPVVDMRLYTGAAERQWRDQQLGATRYACLAPTAQWRCKCWPLDRYAALARRLIDSRAVEQVVVLAAPHEHAALQPLLDDAGPNVRLPGTSVGQMMALIEGAQMVVGNDSAAIHAAAGFDRPMVAVFGPTLPSQVGPYQRDHCVVQPPGVDLTLARWHRRHKRDQRLIAQVDFDTVWDAVQRQMGMG